MQVILTHKLDLNRVAIVFQFFSNNEIILQFLKIKST
jgi:hypothetical protein